MRRQCKLLGVARSSVEYEAVPECSEDLKAKVLLDKIYREDTCRGRALHRSEERAVGILTMAGRGQGEVDGLQGGGVSGDVAGF